MRLMEYKKGINMDTTKAEADKALDYLKSFIGKSQISVIRRACRGEEKQWFFDMLVKLADLIKTMPVTYEQDGKGEEAIVYLHYFTGGADWFIYEKDVEPEQLQAFGLADLFGDGGELGYISIVELIADEVELDLHWTPKPLKECRKH